MNIILTVLSLGLLVFIHELGHFLTARYFNVKIDKFSIGFGPKLISFTKNSTEYAISLIPLGGYVKMKGENPDPDDKDDIINDEDCFKNKKWWQRALIAFAGPMFNVMLASLLLFVSFLVGKSYYDLSPVIKIAEEPYSSYFQQGDIVLNVNSYDIRTWTDIYKNLKNNDVNIFMIRSSEDNDAREITLFISNRNEFFNSLTPVTSTVIGEVSSGMPAWRAGLKTNDKILEIDGLTVNDWTDVRQAIQNSVSEEVVIKVERSDDFEVKILDFIVFPLDNPLESGSSRMIGISQALDVSVYESYSIIDSAKLSIFTTVGFIYFNYRTLFTLVRNPGSLKDSIGGPVMVFSMTSESYKRGFSDLMMFIAAISILLMIMNLLPIPVLDGGHIIFCIIEGIFKKPVSQKVQMISQQIGFMLLISLMFYAFYSDFNRLSQRHISLKNTGESIPNP